MTGWCSTHNHGDHYQRPTCVNWISDADATAALIAEARENEPPGYDGGQAARYVAQYRPY